MVGTQVGCHRRRVGECGFISVPVHTNDALHQVEVGYPAFHVEDALGGVGDDSAVCLELGLDSPVDSLVCRVVCQTCLWFVHRCRLENLVAVGFGCDGDLQVECLQVCQRLD